MAVLYDDILQISRDYMGIVAESYVARRCKNSLSLDDPKLITVDQLELFAQGVLQTGEVYMKPEKVREFAIELMKLKEKRATSHFTTRYRGSEVDSNDFR